MDVRDIQIDQIVEGRNIRLEADAENEGLQESMRKYGQLQPIIVVPLMGKYKIVSGYRRFEACRRRGEVSVPCVISELEQQDIPLVRLIENTQRKNLSPVELATAFDELIADGMTRAEIAVLIGKSTAWIAEQFRVAKLQTELKDEGMTQEAIDSIPASTIKKLAPIKDPEERRKYVRKPEKAAEAESYQPQRRNAHEIEPRVVVKLAGDNTLLVSCPDKKTSEEFKHIVYAWVYQVESCFEVTTVRMREGKIISTNVNGEDRSLFRYMFAEGIDEKLRERGYDPETMIFAIGRRAAAGEGE